jgi:RNA polymerase sigma-B factor
VHRRGERQGTSADSLGRYDGPDVEATEVPTIRTTAPVNEHQAENRARSRLAERDLALRYHRDDDLRAREELVERFIPLARELALRYSYTDEPFEDLLQVASVGLIKAVDRYEPRRGTKFTSYAVPTILGELKRHFRDKGWALHVPRELQERALAVSRESDRLSIRLGRSPSVREVAKALDCSVEQVLEASEAAGSYETASLDAPASRNGEGPTPLLDLVGGDDGDYDLVGSREAIAETWRALPEMEQRVIQLRFVEDLTQREIGERIGFSQMHVSRLMRRALGRLQAAAA